MVAEAVVSGCVAAVAVPEEVNEMEDRVGAAEKFG